MVNNCTNINKTNNNLSPKGSFNSDGQQFHQYQQQTIISHLKKVTIQQNQSHLTIISHLKSLNSDGQQLVNSHLKKV